MNNFVNKFKNMNKVTKTNTITYSLVVAAYLIIQMLVMTGNISSLMKGLLVPMCVYAIAAISLNLVVGLSGELSLGHAGFMCVGPNKYLLIHYNILLLLFHSLL